MSCPICEVPASPFFHLAGSPVLQNVLCATPAEALAVELVAVDFSYCSACHFVFNARFDRALVQYTPAYDNDQNSSLEYRQFIEEVVADLVENCALSSSSAVLEIGSGNGYFLSRLRHAMGSDEVVGHDPAYDGQYSMAEFIRPSYYAPEDGRIFDLVVFRHCLEALFDEDAVLRNVASAMHPRGRLYIEVLSLEYLLDRGAAALLSYEYARYYSLRALQRVLARHGFELENARPLFGRNYLGCLFRKRPILPALPDPFAALRDTASAYERVVLWGIGGRGVSFLAQSPWARERVRCVDINPSKQGQFVPLTAHPVVSPTDAKKLDPQLVIVSNANYFPEIERVLGPERHYVTLEGQRLETRQRVEVVK